MPDQAQQRIQAIGQQLQGGTSASDTGLPPITKIATGSSSPRAKDKVVIITGKIHSCRISERS